MADRKNVYTIIEREGQGEKKSFWVRIGSAFVNRDGSLNVKLDALPVNGTMQIRDPEEKEDRDRSHGNSDRRDDRRDDRNHDDRRQDRR